MIEIDSLGTLRPHPELPEEWLISKPIVVPFFDGKELDFTISFDWEDKKSLFEANQAVENFLRKDASEKLNVSSLVYKNYREIQDYYDSQTRGASPLKTNDENDIWNYVYPGNGFISQGSRVDKCMYILITCGCEWEIEHGLQLVFKNGLELTRVSGIDYSPTE